MAKHRGPETGTPALRVLHEAGVAHTLHPYPHTEGETRFGDEAVRALQEAGVDVSPERVLKTLLTDVDGRLVVAVLPVASTLDLKALAAAAGGKRATMAEPARAVRSSGYVLGGISPLGQRTRLPTVVDGAALAWPSVLVSGGRRGLQVELSPADLVRLSDATTADLARRPAVQPGQDA